ncbi:tyrosine recombinase XerC [Chloroflexota bacterium]
MEADVIDKILDISRDKPRDHLILRLMADAGLRRDELVRLRVKNVGQKALRFRDKGDKDRTVPMTEALAAAVMPFCTDKDPEDPVVSVGEGVIYRTVKKHGMLIGMPELKPHDLRHAFDTRLLGRGVNIRVVQELLGHSNLNTTQAYMAISGTHLETAIRTLSEAPEAKVLRDQLHALMMLVEHPKKEKRVVEPLLIEPAVAPETGMQCQLTISMLEERRRVVDPKTGQCARLVKFRLGSESAEPIIIENLCLEILESETHDFGPGLEGLLQPFQYDIELPLRSPRDYQITEDQFKLTQHDVDDFELLCTAIPGLVCRVRVKVYYIKHPNTEILTECSKPFYLKFPKGGWKCRPEELPDYIVEQSLDAPLKNPVECKNSFVEVDGGELRVYLGETLSEEKLRDIQ